MGVLLSVLSVPSASQICIPFAIPCIESTSQAHQLGVTSFVQLTQGIQRVGGAIRARHQNRGIQIRDFLLHHLDKIGVVFLGDDLLLQFRVVSGFGVDNGHADAALDLADGVQFQLGADVEIFVASLGDQNATFFSVGNRLLGERCEDLVDVFGVRVLGDHGAGGEGRGSTAGDGAGSGGLDDSAAEW